ncbi:hypothetical protein NQ317_007655 [Molorchus minor]|uniref:GATA zinc finger domain-containing protein 1 n=1 Tax=Molorchus minor TaxID=1323400 RepID=A0ABQ9JR79_9CUCU|nr:hypothetical protein NQ317_007655 [Molorchus minor]
MPLKGPPVCLKCESNESPLWTNAENLGAICLDCVNETKNNLKLELDDEEDDSKGKRKIRTTRSYKTRLNPFAGSYIQVGDIVSLKDVEGDTYYAQIKGLLIDQYCHKSAVITWLLPTQESPPPNEEFDPATYIIGPEEDIPRSLDSMEFIMHAPSDYYKSATTPYPTANAPARPGYVWTSMETMQRLCRTEINKKMSSN